MAIRTDTSYTFGVRLPCLIADARAALEPALRAEGFGVLTEIDVAATIKAKLGLEVPPYLILGVCNPRMAHRAIEAEASIGALLPCNVVLREAAGETVAEFMDPKAVLGIVESPEIESIADEARERLMRVVSVLECR
jgi:uncharacterized protein (DUF302 family)